jgi:hypothetical protein
VRAGLGAYTDKAGKVWAADTGFTGGSASTTGAAIAGTTDPALYQGERWGDFSYQFAVPNGTYTVTLKFAEIYWTQKGQRVFNVALNGQAVLTNFDILAQVAPNTALDKSFTVAVTGGTLTAAFTTVTDAAKLSAIAIGPGTGANVVPENRVGGVLNDARDPATFPGRGIGGIARDRQPSKPEFTLVEMSITESTGRPSRYTGVKIASSPSIQAATVSRATG